MDDLKRGARALTRSPGAPGEGRGEGLRESRITEALSPTLSQNTGRGSHRFPLLDRRDDRLRLVAGHDCDRMNAIAGRATLPPSRVTFRHNRRLRRSTAPPTPSVHGP